VDIDSKVRNASGFPMVLQRQHVYRAITDCLLCKVPGTWWSEDDSAATYTAILNPAQVTSLNPTSNEFVIALFMDGAGDVSSSGPIEYARLLAEDCFIEWSSLSQATIRRMRTAFATWEPSDHVSSPFECLCSGSMQIDDCTLGCAGSG